jgi:hypothetical protein
MVCSAFAKSAPELTAADVSQKEDPANRLPDPQAGDRQELALQSQTTEAMLRQLEYLLKTHGDEEARSDQCSLGDILSGLRNLADDLGLDFGAALAGSDVVSDEPPTLSAFDWCI